MQQQYTKKVYIAHRAYYRGIDGRENSTELIDEALKAGKFNKSISFQIVLLFVC
jgi:hypothetical protein